MSASHKLNANFIEFVYILKFHTLDNNNQKVASGELPNILIAKLIDVKILKLVVKATCSLAFSPYLYSQP